MIFETILNDAMRTPAGLLAALPCSGESRSPSRSGVPRPERNLVGLRIWLVDRNFGAATPLWDWLFGTAYSPEEDEWPDVGLAGLDEPVSVGEWSDLPWRVRQTAAAATNAIVDRYARIG